MSYQVLARKWRPQSFDAVIGQPAVTRTLRNAVSGGRIHHAFVFAGPRGVGKTTTARILARALNCVNGPTTDPCGQCDACREIADGRDIDVLEIDAATHTQVETVREVIISGLAIMPVRDRYKVFIIDEVHQLSASSFNALLKSIEEPPAHVVFMMATTELTKIPETVLSRAQVFEFRPIPSRVIAAHLRTIADAESLDVPDDALALIGRAAEGSMRDAQSAFDQVIAFAGDTIILDDVTTVLGLVARDVLFDIVNVVADEDAPRVFDLAARVVEQGYDLRLVCRELSRLVRDLLVVSVDPARVKDPEIGSESEADMLRALAARFSREDLLRAFDVLSRAENEVRSSAQPRYNLEMALLRWIHLRRLVPLAQLLEKLGQGAQNQPGPGASTRPSQAARSTPPPPAPAATTARAHDRSPETDRVPAGPEPTPAPVSDATDGFKDKFLAEVRRARAVLYNTVVAQAQKIEVDGSQVTFTYLPNHRTLREKLDQSRPWLEQVASEAAGRKMNVRSAQQEGVAAIADSTGATNPTNPSGEPRKITNLKAEAMADAAVQAMLDVFPAEIRDVEEM
jgi:DNA polymerase III subunit gamma/tau